VSLRIPAAEAGRIRDHARRAYPHECCGVLFGRESNRSKAVVESRPVENARRDSPCNRFLVTAGDFRQFERYARERGLEIVGFYHSHPDGPARPSEYDRENAWPWFSYVIVSVVNGEPGEMTSWELAEDRSAMSPERIETEN
jgi:proteasome lid subunit RPN8/RPN11